MLRKILFILFCIVLSAHLYASNQVALFRAIREGDLDSFNTLIALSDVDINACENTDWGDTPLILALYGVPRKKTMALGSQVQRLIVTALLDNGASAEKYNLNGASPIEYLSWSNPDLFSDNDTCYYDPDIARLIEEKLK